VSTITIIHVFCFGLFCLKVAAAVFEFAAIQQMAMNQIASSDCETF